MAAALEFDDVLTGAVFTESTGDKMNNDFVLPHQLSVNVPHLAEYFGIWAIFEPVFRGAVGQCNGLNLHAHIEMQMAKGPSSASGQASTQYQVDQNGIAYFYVSGPTMKYTSSLTGGTSTVALRQQIRAAAKNSAVVGGMLIMDTPGGTLKGNSDLAQEVASFAARKPIYAFIEDMTASAGVATASQATKRFANNGSALYGSIGSYAVIMDQSSRAEKLGVKVHVIKAGEFKGMGEPGTAITEQHLAELQRVLNTLNQEYITQIATGLRRSADAIQKIADGRIHMAKDAVKLGLIDGIQSFEETYRLMLRAVAKAKPEPAATMAELQSAFPNSTAEWRSAMCGIGASIVKAAQMYAAIIEADSINKKAALQKQLDDVIARQSRHVGNGRAHGRR